MGQERIARGLVKAVDTNVVLRILMGDDPAQTTIALGLLDGGIVLVPTVLLECAWVMRSRYGLDRSNTAAMLTKLVELPGVHIHEAAWVTWSIARFADGADIADMIHIVAACRTAGFYTFDRAIAHAVGLHSPIPIETLG